MSAEEFWKDDPQLFVSYRTSFINKKKREAEEEDYKCWLQGLYIHDGNGKLVSSLKQLLINMFSSNKDRTKIDQYPMKPYHLIEKEKQLEEFMGTLVWLWDNMDYENNDAPSCKLNQIENVKRCNKCYKIPLIKPIIRSTLIIYSLRKTCR